MTRLEMLKDLKQRVENREFARFFYYDPETEKCCVVGHIFKANGVGTGTLEKMESDGVWSVLRDFNLNFDNLGGFTQDELSKMQALNDGKMYDRLDEYIQELIDTEEKEVSV